MPTDTLYGVVGQALNKETVARIYTVRRRSPEKPFIILVSDEEQIHQLGAKVSISAQAVLKKYWPGPVSIVLPCEEAEFFYLHRGTKTLAFRMPKDQWLRDLIAQTGPLVAPSANPEGLPPAKTIAEAQEYFGNDVDFYEDDGRRHSEPSTLITIKDGKVIVLRQGSVVIPE